MKTHTPSFYIFHEEKELIHSLRIEIIWQNTDMKQLARQYSQFLTQSPRAKLLAHVI